MTDDPLGPSRRQQREAEKAAAISPETWTRVPGRPGFFRSGDGRLKYDPFKDPAWIREVHNHPPL